MVLGCCKIMACTTVYRIAISQVVVMVSVTLLFILLGAFTLDDLDYDEDKTLLRRGFYVCASLYIVPSFFGVVLLIGILRNSAAVVRMWILVSILETVIIFTITLSGSIFFASYLKVHYGIILIAVQVILALWKMESIVIINSFYRENLASSQPLPSGKNLSV